MHAKSHHKIHRFRGDAFYDSKLDFDEETVKNVELQH